MAELTEFSDRNRSVAPTFLMGWRNLLNAAAKVIRQKMQYLLPGAIVELIQPTGGSLKRSNGRLEISLEFSESRLLIFSAMANIQ